MSFGASPNPALRQLGFDDSDRVVVLHADDIGMCQATIEAWDNLVDSGFPLSCSVMVPCPWFSAFASIVRQKDQRTLDIGIHATLTSEWRYYRWRPVSTRDPATGLLDSEGFLPRSVDALRTSATHQAVRTELHTQALLATAAGIDLSHIDSHMGAVFCPTLLRAYMDVARECRLLAVWFRSNKAICEIGLGPDETKAMIEMSQQCEHEQMPLVDYLLHMQLDDPKERLEQVKHELSSLPAGLTHFMIHPAIDTPELRAITPDWPCRVADYATFMDGRLRSFLKGSGIHFVTYRELRGTLATHST